MKFNSAFKELKCINVAGEYVEKEMQFPLLEICSFILLTLKSRFDLNAPCNNNNSTTNIKNGSRGGAVGCGTALQARRSRVPLPNISLEHFINPLNPELNPICYLLALLGAYHFLHVNRIRVKSLTLRLLMSYIHGAPILDVSRSHTTTQHSR